MTADEIDDEEDGERHAEQPKEGVTDLAGLADELFDAFHDNDESARGIAPRVPAP